MITVDLSLDFDFFIRENPMWDFGHSEHGGFSYGTAIWEMRYSHIDLYQETNPRIYADFVPGALWAELDGKGFRFDRFKGNRQSGIADSHTHAFKFFSQKRGGPPDVLVNMDAHHDAWPGPAQNRKLGCDNWIPYLRPQLPISTRIVQLYPKWKSIKDDGPPSVSMDVGYWKDFEIPQGEEWQVRRIFLCRSSAWVPPHHDPDFVIVASKLYAMSRNLKALDFIGQRDFPSEERARAALENMTKRFKDLESLNPGMVRL